MTSNDTSCGKDMRGAAIGLGVAGIICVVCAALAGFFGAGWLASLATFFVIGLGALTYYVAHYMPGRPSAAPLPVAASGLPGVARDVLECLDDPLVLLDETGRVVFANSASEAVLGGSLVRKHISGVVRVPQLLEAIDNVVAHGGAQRVEFSFLVPLERHYEAYVGRTQAGSGSAPMVLLQLHETTEQRRVEQMRVDFIANASHELRTPLAAVSGFIDTLKGYAKDDPAAREKFLDIMSVETGRMRRLIDDLLSLSRIELNEHNPPRGEANLVQVVRDAVAVLTPLAAADKVTMEVADHAPLIVAGERDELIQVFQNLIHNAIKYGRAGGRVRVRFGEALVQGRGAAHIQFFAAIEDEGEGIPREAIPRLTERFYRVDIKRSRERGGTGLGLAIVKHILNRHHGRLQIESTIGKGSIFTVFLPASGAQLPSA